MAEYSFPVEEQPMPSMNWSSVTKGIGNGILDQGAFPYRLKSLDNATNTAVIQAANLGDNTLISHAILEGFYHKIDEDVTISLPAVTTATTYYVVLSFDPIRGTEQGVPVKLEVVKSLSTTGGKNYLHLYNVRRQPNQLLTDADIRMVRPRVAPVTVYASEADMPQAYKTLWGALAVVHGGRGAGAAKIFMSMNGDAEESINGRVWQLLYDQNPDGTYAWTNRADTDSYVSPGHGYRRAIGRRGKKRAFHGRVARAAGTVYSPGNSYSIWSSSLPASDAPAESQRFITGVQGSGANYAVVDIAKTGEVTAFVAGTTYWIGLDGIEWETA